MAGMLNTIEVETAPMPLFSVIWMHGLGAAGTAFAPVVPMLKLGEIPGIRFVFPDAPRIPVTCSGGTVMPAWYDIISIAGNVRKIDEAGLLQSREAIRRLIARENGRGIPAGRIFLAGFSQGGAMAYATGLTHPEPLAGVIALSTYLPSSEAVARELGGGDRGTPLFVAHGSRDEVVSLELGEQARDALSEMGYRPEWHVFPMRHSVSIRELRAIGAWLGRSVEAIAAEAGA